jgi:hypothetical protein
MPTVIAPATLSFSGSVPRNVQCLASGVPLRLGANRIVVTLLSLSPYPTCLPPVHALPASASLREIFRGRLQRNHRSSAGCHRRRFTFPTPTDIPLNTSRSLMKRPSASLSVRFQPGRRDKRRFNRAERTTRSHLNPVAAVVSAATQGTISPCYAGDSRPPRELGLSDEMTWRSTRAAVCAYVAAQ